MEPEAVQLTLSQAVDTSMYPSSDPSVTTAESADSELKVKSVIVLAERVSCDHKAQMNIHLKTHKVCS